MVRKWQCLHVSILCSQSQGREDGAEVDGYFVGRAKAPGRIPYIPPAHAELEADKRPEENGNSY